MSDGTDNFGGSDTLTNEQIAAQDAYYEQLTVKYEQAAQASSDTKQWLNTPLGKALREAIAANKFDAMQRGVDGESDNMKAKFDYAVWCAVEGVFTQIIIEGAEALKSLDIQQGA